jgi:endonuclease/exonuclease/phosphatase family metal-dependent hydrolase
VVLGEFNLIRGPQNKNNDNINWPLVNLFNECIARLALHEIVRSGAAFTWSNKQRKLVQCMLDRVLVSLEWEAQFPLVSLKAETRFGSDHASLLLSTREELRWKETRFFFETS